MFYDFLLVPFQFEQQSIVTEQGKQAISETGIRNWRISSDTLKLKKKIPIYYVANSVTYRQWVNPKR